MTLPLNNPPLAECFNLDKESGNEQITAGAARMLRIVGQRLFNWVEAQRRGRLRAVDSEPASAEQREISRLRAELAREKIKRDILGKATVSAMQEGRFEVPLHQALPASLSCLGAFLGAEGQRGRPSRAIASVVGDAPMDGGPKTWTGTRSAYWLACNPPY